MRAHIVYNVLLFLRRYETNSLYLKTTRKLIHALNSWLIFEPTPGGRSAGFVVCAKQGRSVPEPNKKMKK
jgi:hypothetical protein